MSDLTIFASLVKFKFFPAGNFIKKPREKFYSNEKEVKRNAITLFEPSRAFKKPTNSLLSLIEEGVVMHCSTHLTY